MIEAVVDCCRIKQKCHQWRGDPGKHRGAFSSHSASFVTTLLLLPFTDGTHRATLVLVEQFCVLNGMSPFEGVLWTKSPEIAC